MEKMNTQSTRRSILRRIASAGGMVSTTGLGSAVNQQVGESTEVYVVLAGGPDLPRKLRSEGYEIRHELAGGSVYIVQGPEDLRQHLESIPAVAGAVSNRTTVIEAERFATDDGENATDSRVTDQWNMERINTVQAQKIATGAGTTLAVIDSGVSHSHPALAPQIDADRSRFFRNGHIYANQGTIDLLSEVPQWWERKTLTSAERPVADDVNGHGTHVAGIAAASRDGKGIVGVAPDATIVSLRTQFYQVNTIGGDRTGRLVSTFIDLLLAIDYAAEIGVDVVNLSQGLDPLFPRVERRRLFAAFRRVIQHTIASGTIIVTATGNDGIDLAVDERQVLPAQNRGAISVTATGPNDRRSYYANYGDTVVNVAAPGGGYETSSKTDVVDPEAVAYPFPTNGVLSTVPSDIYGTHHDYLMGTSAAAPHVAGLACLLRELFRDSHPRRIKQAIQQGAVELDGEYTSGLGAGRIDALEAVQWASKAFR